MRKIAFLLVPFLGVALAKSEKMMEQKSEMVQLVKLDPRKNYRVKMASSTLAVGVGAAISGTDFVAGKEKREKLRF
jgi:hypothetical protein